MALATLLFVGVAHAEDAETREHVIYAPFPRCSDPLTPYARAAVFFSNLRKEGIQFEPRHTEGSFDSLLLLEDAVKSLAIVQADVLFHYLKGAHPQFPAPAVNSKVRAIARLFRERMYFAASDAVHVDGDHLIRNASNAFAGDPGSGTRVTAINIGRTLLTRWKDDVSRSRSDAALVLSVRHEPPLESNANLVYLSLSSAKILKNAFRDVYWAKEAETSGDGAYVELDAFLVGTEDLEADTVLRLEEIVKSRASGADPPKVGEASSCFDGTKVANWDGKVVHPRFENAAAPARNFPIARHRALVLRREDPNFRMVKFAQDQKFGLAALGGLALIVFMGFAIAGVEALSKLANPAGEAPRSPSLEQKPPQHSRSDVISLVFSLLLIVFMAVCWSVWERARSLRAWEALQLVPVLLLSLSLWTREVGLVIAKFFRTPAPPRFPERSRLVRLSLSAWSLGMLKLLFVPAIAFTVAWPLSASPAALLPTLVISLFAAFILLANVLRTDCVVALAEGPRVGGFVRWFRYHFLWLRYSSLSQRLMWVPILLFVGATAVAGWTLWAFEYDAATLEPETEISREGPGFALLAVLKSSILGPSLTLRSPQSEVLVTAMRLLGIFLIAVLSLYGTRIAVRELNRPGRRMLIIGDPDATVSESPPAPPTMKRAPWVTALGQRAVGRPFRFELREALSRYGVADDEKTVHYCAAVDVGLMMFDYQRVSAIVILHDIAAQKAAGFPSEATAAPKTPLSPSGEASRSPNRERKRAEWVQHIVDCILREPVPRNGDPGARRPLIYVDQESGDFEDEKDGILPLPTFSEPGAAQSFLESHITQADDRARSVVWKRILFLGVPFAMVLVVIVGIIVFRSLAGS